MKIFKLAAGLRRLFVSGLFVSSVILILTAGSQSANALTAYFFGPAWDPTECAYAFPFGNCIGGAVSGTVNFDGVADNYSGWIYTTPTSWSLNASGITSLSTGDTLYDSQFDFSSGQVVVGVMAAQNVSDPANYRSIGTNGYGAYDYADTYNSNTGQYINNGYISYGGYNSTGAWLNPKALGLPASYPKVANANPSINPPKKPDCPCDGSVPGVRGEPINLGTGNMYEQVTDYTTVGQNPLAFIRYYNSMAYGQYSGHGVGP